MSDTSQSTKPPMPVERIQHECRIAQNEINLVLYGLNTRTGLYVTIEVFQSAIGDRVMLYGKVPASPYPPERTEAG